MPKGRDWIPSKESKLIELIAVWQTKLGESNLQNAYGWVADECVAVKNTLTAFINARNAFQNAPTAGNSTEKAEKKEIAVEILRKFAREHIRYNSKISDGEKEALGVNTPDRNPSPVTIPDMGPESEAVINAREPGVVKVKYMGAKPYGVGRVEIAWLVADEAVDSPEQLPNHETFSHNPWEKIFPAGERGRKMFYSLRYLASDGESHWSDVRELLIP